MVENPRSIASQLISERGPEGAVKTVREAIAAAHSSGDNYGLSIWREVRLAVRNHPIDEVSEPAA
jgi:hypothetical protein